MGWERRGHRWYFYRSRRVGKHVRKIYLGTSAEILLDDAEIRRKEFDWLRRHGLMVDSLLPSMKET